MTTRTPSWVAQDYRFRNDDGDFGAATYIAANNTPVNLVLGQKFRLRLNFGDINNANSSNVTAFKLQFRVNAGTWTDVTSSTAVRPATSTHIGDTSTDTTQRLPALGGSTFTAAYSEFDSNGALTSRTWADQYAECEFCLTLFSGTVGQTLEFRVVTTGNVVPAITNTATATQVTPTDVLTASSITTSAPSLSAVTLLLTDILATTNVVSGPPAFGTPTAGDIVAGGAQLQISLIQFIIPAGPPGVHPLVSTGITGGAATIGTPVVVGEAIVFDLTTSPVVTDAATLGTPALVGQAIVFPLTTNSVATAAPTFGQPSISQVHNLTADHLVTAAPIIDIPTVTGIVLTFALSASSIATAAPFIDSATFAQNNNLTAMYLITGTPVISTPTVSLVGLLIELTSSNIANGASFITAPTLGQNHTLSGNVLETGPPVLTQPTIQEYHILTASSFASQAATISIGSMASRDDLLSANITAGTATITVATIQHIIPVTALTANYLVTGALVLGTPSITQNHLNTANSITTGAASISTPSTGLILPTDLTATSLTTAAPVITQAVFRQTNDLETTSISTGAPTFDQSVLGHVYVFTANGLTTGALTLDTPLISQLHVMVSNGIISTSAITLALIGQFHFFTPQSFTTGLAAFGTPTLRDLLPWTPVPFTDLIGIVGLTEELIGVVHPEEDLIGIVEPQLQLSAIIWTEGQMAGSASIDAAYSQEIRLHVGASKRLRFACVDPDGNPVLVGLGATGKWWAAKSARTPIGDVPLKIDGSVVNENGQSFLIVDIDPDDTVAMTPLNYYHEGEVYDGPNVYTVASGTLRLLPSLVR